MVALALDLVSGEEALTSKDPVSTKGGHGEGCIILPNVVTDVLGMLIVLSEKSMKYLWCLLQGIELDLATSAAHAPSFPRPLLCTAVSADIADALW